jgi:D-arabinose 1-dehydrogenase-like Zn-dependent alcohol dehydrogenase
MATSNGKNGTSALRKIPFHAFHGSPSGQLVKKQGEHELKPGQVVVRVTHSGICATDVHMQHHNMALGHEGVGVVEEVYPGVTDVKVGDRVGFGYVHWTCGQCETCLKGELLPPDVSKPHFDPPLLTCVWCWCAGHDQYCLNREEYITHNTDQGSYGSHVVWFARNLFVLPEGLESRYAGPLMCGGETVWGALVSSGRPLLAGETVGVVGIGGLGHLAIQFAAKMGAQVIAFSSTESKREEALAFGADRFYATKGLEKFPDELTKKIDHLVMTTSEQPNFQL